MTIIMPAGNSHFAAESLDLRLLAAILAAAKSSPQSGMSPISANANHMIDPPTVDETMNEGTATLASNEILNSFLAALMMNQQAQEQPDSRPAQDLPSLRHTDEQGHQFLKDLKVTTAASARTGPRVVEVDLVVERHGQGTHNVDYGDEIDTHLTAALGQRQVHSTAHQVLTGVASGLFPKFDLIIDSPLERCSETSLPTRRDINKITHVNGLAQHETKTGVWAQAREILNPGRSGGHGPSHVRSDRDFSTRPFLGAKGFEGSTDAWKHFLYENACQGEARGGDLKNGVGRLMGGFCSMTNRDSASILLSSHAEILHELHNAAMDEQGWNHDNGFVNASTKGYKMKVLINGTYGSADFDTQILSIKRNTAADFKPKESDLVNDDILKATWDPETAKLASTTTLPTEGPTHPISAPTMCELPSVLKTWSEKILASASESNTDTKSDTGDTLTSAYNRGRRTEQLKTALQSWIDTERSTLPKDGYRLRTPTRFARQVMSASDMISAF